MTNTVLEKKGSIHPSAVIHPSAEIGEGVIIGPNVVIGEGVKLGNGTRVSILNYRFRTSGFGLQRRADKSCYRR